METLLFSPNRSEMIAGLGEEETLHPSKLGGLIYELAKQYQNPEVVLPPGVSEEAFRLICVTAGARRDVWEELENKDSKNRLVKVVIYRFLLGRSS